jgi:hypothetical protein
MFESALLRKSGEGYNSIDIGLIAETLMFYGKVHLLLHRGSLQDLVQKIGIPLVLDLIDKGYLSITYIREDYGVSSTVRNDIQSLRFSYFYLTGLANGKKIRNALQDVEEVLRENLGSTRASKKLFQGLAEKINVKNQKSCEEDAAEICKQATLDLQNGEFIRNSVKEILNSIVPNFELEKNWRFEIILMDDEFIIDTNISFEHLNRYFEKIHPGLKGEITPSYVLASYLEAYVDFLFSSRYASDLVTKKENSAIIRNKMSSLVISRENNLRQIKMFEEVVLNNVDCIREAINSGEKEFKDFVKLLDKSRRFKNFLNSRNPDSLLVKEYYEQNFKKNFIESPIPKVFRFFVSLGLGSALDSIDPTRVGSFAASAADTFLLDRLFRGWRPSHFVNGPLRKFVEG